jgi:CheY-like chemotaxis protein
MSKKILVVEDESEVRDLVKCVLENNGYETVTADNGLEGLKKAHVEMPDLIISDLVMDKMPGGVMRERLKQDQKTCNIPVLYLTSVINVEEAEMIQQRLAGEPTLAKPFEDSELLAKVKELLK